ncbi:MAG TPA: sigma-70 family RNA polymerase sigma factor [Deferrisomatales bacterium]|nr:sigma-70 family RNA polymerase sigma factor [Deferrisomatales bacterium]
MERLEFDTVHDEYRQRIFHYLEGMLGAAEAEELTQETFLKVSRALPEFRGESQLSTWVYRIATHVALDRLRSRSFKEGLRSLSTEEDEVAGALPDADVWSGEEKPSVTQTLAREEMNACIRGVVEELPENYRAVLVLSEFEGLKDREIAEIVGDSLGAVKIRLHRGRARLKAALETKCTFHRDERDVFGCEPKPIELTDIRPRK